MGNQKKEAIKKLMEMGFDEPTVISALDNCDGNQESALEYILSSAFNKPSIPYRQNPNVPVNIKPGEDDMQKAIALSIKENSKSQPIEIKERDQSIPLGLKNTSSIPFFSSLIQIYYSLPFFRKLILSQSIIIQTEDPRKKKLFKLISELNLLFKLMETSKMKYEDTVGVVNAFADIDGAQLVNNEKSHVGDFSMRFVSRVEEGLRYLNSQSDEEIVKAKEDMSFLIEGSMLSGMFFGKMIPKIRAKKPDGVKIREELGPLTFGKFEVEVDKKEIYEAWRSALAKEIDLFQVAEGVNVKAKQINWIDILPGVLIFEINRLTTDSKGNISKAIKPFSFPMTLYPGRFLLKNSKKTVKLQRTMANKKKSLKQLENTIESFENFNNRKQNISQMLKLCSNFLENQNNQELKIGNDEIYVDPPLPIEKKPTLEIACKVIGDYSEKVQSTLEEMKEKLRTCEKDVENIFDEEKFKKSEYELHAVIVHDGDVAGGQVYAYMKRNGMWKKFHDINVTEIGEKSVIFDSLGEYGISGACCLIYVDNNLLREN
ncbi:hypothetical protein SteCoe_7732 [Stentor coeruleus]|uniref:ubiquitinyl hydrolase 1 n=1 Tax=Stentor coeruleus TaxID=5963 RepID=A0A1R2CM81_9CILI|nr:hypothetical protein SteCoe_7732 [Stentor coeruleus]